MNNPITFANKIKCWFLNLQVVVFIKSLKAYLRLYKAGFRIYNSETSFGHNFEINRFFWASKGESKIIRDMCDIDCVNGKYITVRDGHTEEL